MSPSFNTPLLDKKIIITAVPVLQLTASLYNQIEFEVALSITNLFLVIFPKKSPLIPRPKTENTSEIIGKLFLE